MIKKFLIILIGIIIPLVSVFLLYQKVNIFLIFNDFINLLDDDEIELVINTIVNIPTFVFFKLFFYSIFIIFILLAISFGFLIEKPNIDFIYNHTYLIRAPPTYFAKAKILFFNWSKLI